MDRPFLLNYHGIIASVHTAIELNVLAARRQRATSLAVRLPCN